MVGDKILLKELKNELIFILKENILKYWTENTVDYSNGGFIGHINFDNTKVIDANKGIILYTRILWSFSNSYKYFNDPLYLNLADRAYNYLLDNFKDKINGGVFWELDYLGHPVNKKKQVYAQAFAIYALTEYYKVSDNIEALNWAIQLFYLIEEFSKDEKNGGYIEAFDEDWLPIENVGLSPKEGNDKKTMNTHLHILEAYSNLLRVWPDGELRKAQTHLINLFLSKFLANDFHFYLFFDEEWKLTSDKISFGHDIEAAWLIAEAARVLNNKDLMMRAEAAAVKISDSVMLEGLDFDGSIFNEKERISGDFDYDKHWWQQAEGMVGFMEAYQISGDEKFLESVFSLWKFIKEKLIDSIHGEWYWKVDRNGSPFSEDEKVGQWKCPYHNTRSCLELIKRIDNVITNESELS